MYRYQTEVEVLRAGDSASAWFDGVIRCRTRACPVCWISRRSKLAHEIQHVVDSRVAETKQVPLLATMTIRHSEADPVSICRAVRECWRKFINKRAWKQFREQAGLQWVIAEEVTRGAHGWHPHLHALLLPRTRSGDLLERGEWWWENWAAVVERELGPANVPSLAHGADLRPCTTAGYLTKLGIEMTDAGAVKGRAPLALLQAGELEKYMELQLSRHRARDLTFSRGLKPYRDTLPPPPPAELQLRLRGSEYERLASKGHDACLAVLAAAGKGGAEARATAEWYLGPLATDVDDQLGSERVSGDALRTETAAASASLAHLGFAQRSPHPEALAKRRAELDEFEALELQVWAAERQRRQGT